MAFLQERPASLKVKHLNLTLQVAAGYVFHVGEVQGVLKVGDTVKAAIDSKRRYRIAANHTMTHVLNYGLREVSWQSSSLTNKIEQPVLATKVWPCKNTRLP